MGNDGILPIICETTRNANMADVIHCHSTEVISEGTWKSLIFYLSTMRDYKRRAAPRHMGCRPGLAMCSITSASQMKGVGRATQVSHPHKLLGTRGAANHLCEPPWTLCETPWRATLNS